MHTVTIEVYPFDELSEKAKQKAIAKYWDINVNYDWWEGIYEDASNVYIEITGFDLGRSQEIDLKLTVSPADTANAIIKQHGKDCDTYKAAKKFLEKLQVHNVTYQLIQDDLS